MWYGRIINTYSELAMGSLSFCMGLARSGKSTFCKKWVLDGPNRVVLSGDSFRYAVYGQRFQLVGEEIVRSCLITAARALLHAGCDVMIDDTNTSEASIRHILNIDPLATCYRFTTMLGVCEERAKTCGHDDLLPSLQRMQKNLDRVLPMIHRCEIPIAKMHLIDC